MTKFMGRQAAPLAIGAVFGAILGLNAARGDEFDREPINYSTAAANNPIVQLQEKIAKGQVKLAYHKQLGYLPSLLQALDMPASSQVFVFSKTSLQRQRISPQTPRALYFNDDVYLGYCQYGNVLEISAADPQLGTVFYSLNQEPVERPKFERHTDNCLLCHGSALSRNVPGHVVRSVFADTSGSPVLSMGSFRVDQTTPLSKRWGGWYVTGTHGKQTHLGNLVVRGQRNPDQLDNSQGLNVTNLKDHFDTSAYLTPHSDLIALMVLEHQTEMHNLITKANFQTRIALLDEASLNKELGRPATYRSETTTRRIKSVAEPLLKYMLYSGEAKLTDPLKGTSAFTAEFAKKGPRDPKGRSLRDLDLQTRMFKYPCSYLVYSPSFAALPPVVKDYLMQRLWDVLNNQDGGRDFDHLTRDDRQAIKEILLATMKDLPDYWRK